jgi:hypothetical protein
LGPRQLIVEIVGAADASYTEPAAPRLETIYLPAFQRLDGTANFAVRLAAPAHTDVAALLSAIRAAVRAVDPALPVLNLRTQDEQIERLHAQELLFARVSGLFGLLAVALAGIGLYGLMSHAVIQRTGEIGLRMALGASSAHVLWMILRESLALVCLGIVAGMAAASGSARLVATMLFGAVADGSSDLRFGRPYPRRHRRSRVGRPSAARKPHRSLRCDDNLLNPGRSAPGGEPASA